MASVIPVILIPSLVGGDTSVPISPESARVHGITDEQVAGQSIAAELVEQVVRDAHLILAHNARFDPTDAREALADFRAEALGHAPWPTSTARPKV